MNRLPKKVALVTGAARGIGEAISRAFAIEGAFVLLTDIRNDLGRSVAADIGAGASYSGLDVRCEDDWRRVLRDCLEHFGRLDVLVNNAGVTGFDDTAAAHDPEHAELTTWRSVHETNLDGVFLGCKHAIQAMRRKGTGSIINIGPRSGVVGSQARLPTPRAGSRAEPYEDRGAVLRRAESSHPLQRHSACVHPHADVGPVLGSSPDRAARMGEFTRDTPLRRFGTPAEVAALAVHLASDESAYTTGAEFTLDGGLLAGTAVPPGGLSERSSL